MSTFAEDLKSIKETGDFPPIPLIEGHTKEVYDRIQSIVKLANDNRISVGQIYLNESDLFIMKKSGLVDQNCLFISMFQMDNPILVIRI